MTYRQTQSTSLNICLIDRIKINDFLRLWTILTDIQTTV